MTTQHPPRSSSKARTPPRRRAPMQPVATGDAGDEQQHAIGREQSSRMIFKREVTELVGHSYPTIWSWMRAGTFPLSFDVGGKTAWLQSEIDAWIVSRPRSSLKR